MGYFSEKIGCKFSKDLFSIEHKSCLLSRTVKYRQSGQISETALLVEPGFFTLQEVALLKCSKPIKLSVASLLTVLSGNCYVVLSFMHETKIAQSLVISVLANQEVLIPSGCVFQVFNKCSDVIAECRIYSHVVADQEIKEDVFSPLYVCTDSEAMLHSDYTLCSNIKFLFATDSTESLLKRPIISVRELCSPTLNSKAHQYISKLVDKREEEVQWPQKIYTKTY